MSGPGISGSPLPPPVKPKWYERFRIVIRTGETSVVIAFWLAAVTSKQFIFYSTFFTLGCSTGLISIFTLPKKDFPKKNILGLLMFACFLINEPCLSG